MFSGKDLSTLSLTELDKHYKDQGRLIAALREERTLSEKNYKEAVSGIEDKINKNSTDITELKNKIDRHKSALGPLGRATASTTEPVLPNGIPMPPPPPPGGFSAAPPPPPPPPAPLPPGSAAPKVPVAPKTPIKAAVDPRAELLGAIKDGTKLKKSNTAPGTPVTSDVFEALSNAIDKNRTKKQPVKIGPDKERERLEKNIASRNSTIHKMMGEIKDFRAKTTPSIIQALEQHQTQQSSIKKTLETQEKTLADLKARYTEATKKKIVPPSPPVPSVSAVPGAIPTPPTAPPPPPVFGIPTAPPPPPVFGIPTAPPPPSSTPQVDAQAGRGSLLEAIQLGPKLKKTPGVTDTLGTSKTADISTKKAGDADKPVAQDFHSELEEALRKKEMPATNKVGNKQPAKAVPKDTSQSDFMASLKAGLGSRRNALHEDDDSEDEAYDSEDEGYDEPKKIPKTTALDPAEAAKALKDAQDQLAKDRLAAEKAIQKTLDDRKKVFETLPQTLGITLNLEADTTAIARITQQQSKDLAQLGKNQEPLESFNELLEKMELALQALSKKQAEDALAATLVVEQPKPPIEPAAVAVTAQTDENSMPEPAATMPQDKVLESMALETAALSTQANEAPTASVAVEPTPAMPTLPETAPASEFSPVPSDTLTRPSIAELFADVAGDFVPPVSFVNTPATADDDLEKHEEKPVELPPMSLTTPAVAATAQTDKNPTPEPAAPMPESPEKPKEYFKSLFENIRIADEYKGVKKLSFAQKIHVHNHVREGQLALLDEIKSALISDNAVDDSKHEAIFHATLKILQENLKKEFRWSTLIGIPKHSRLEDIIKQHIKEMEADPNFQQLDSDGNNPLKDVLLKDLERLKLSEIKTKVDTLLSPKSLSHSLSDFMKNAAEMMHIHKKPKP